MELVWDIYYTVLKDGSMIVDQYIWIYIYIYGTTLWSGDKKD